MKCYCPLFCTQKDAAIQYAIYCVAARAGAFLVHAMKASGGSEPPLFSPGSTRRAVGSFTSRPLYLQRQSPRYPWNKRLGGPQQSVWTLWSREKSLVPCRESKSYSSVLDVVKVKVTLCKHRREGGGIALKDSLLGTWWVVSTTPRLLYPGKGPAPTVQEAGWDSEPIWMGLENLVTSGISSPDRPAGRVT